MKYKGITYDIGTEYSPNNLTRDSLSSEQVKFDMNAIKNELNCNSVKIYGKKPEKLLLAAELALHYGLNVWLSPRLINENTDNTLKYLKSIAIEFEKLRTAHPNQELVFIIGGELTIDMTSFVEGNTIHDRIKNLTKPLFFIKNTLGIKPKYQNLFNQFLKDAVALVRNNFSGKITYASAMWEKVEWFDFDFVSMNLYKASFNRSFFNQTIKKLVAIGKPVIITEFGCCSYIGADKKGPTGFSVLDTSKNPPVFKEKCIRNETVQADYIIDLLQTYTKEKVTGVFIFDFYSQKNTFSSIPDNDYDMASFSITKSIENNAWEAKESFYKIGQYYKEQ